MVAAAVLNAYETRRRCVVAMTNLSGDRSLPWRTRLRCFAALLRLSVKGGSRPYLIVSVGGFAHALRALEQWVESKTAGAPLKPGPDSALQLIRMLLDAPAVQATLMKFENVRNGEAAGVILRVLVETPGVRPVQRAGLTAMWALVRLAGPESGVAERLVEGRAGRSLGRDDDGKAKSADVSCTRVYGASLTGASRTVRRTLTSPPPSVAARGATF